MSNLGKFYYIVSKMNGKVLDILHCSNDPGAEVVMWEKKDDEPNNQLWYDDFESCTIRSKQNNLCLTVKDGELCVDEYDDGNDDQKWLFRRHRGVIQNGDERDSVLDIRDCSDDDGARVIAYEENGQDNQQWECERVRCRYFKIRSRLNGKVMDVKGGDDDEGTQVFLWEDKEGDDDDNQYWWEDHNGIIRSKLNDCALQAEADDDGEKLRVYDYEEDNEDQHWIRTGYGVITNRFRRDVALDIYNNSDENGAKIVVWERHGEENQQWDFEYY